MVNLIKVCILYTMLTSYHTEVFSQDGKVSGIPEIAYWRLGNSKETIIVLHGGPATQHEYLRPEFDHLSDFATVIYYDQRGCGMTGLADSYTWQEHVADLRRLIATLAIGQKVILAGSSWGSMLALVYVLQYPQDVKALILTGTVRWHGLGLSKRKLETLKLRGYKPPHEYESTDTITEIRKADYEVAGQTLQRQLTTRWGPPNFDPIFSFKTAPKIKRLKVINQPVLIFKGDQENCFIDWGSAMRSLSREQNFIP